MTLIRAALALAIMAFVASPVFAGDGGNSNFYYQEGTVTTVMPDGTAVQKTISDKEMSMLMAKDATPVTGPVMMMMHDGKMIMMNDKQMPGGKMLSVTLMGN